MGTCSYLREYILGNAELTMCLYKMTKGSDVQKKRPLTWTEETVEAFEALKATSSWETHTN